MAPGPAVCPHDDPADQQGPKPTTGTGWDPRGSSCTENTWTSPTALRVSHFSGWCAGLLSLRMCCCLSDLLYPLRPNLFHHCVKSDCCHKPLSHEVLGMVTLMTEPGWYVRSSLCINSFITSVNKYFELLMHTRLSAQGQWQQRQIPFLPLCLPLAQQLTQNRGHGHWESPLWSASCEITE